uniref:Myb-like domain-containing protein n=1 Tax=Brassica oleracea var. oleracea TaxID=109376 RepID=A0A0D3DQQ0_BRAOL
MKKQMKSLSPAQMKSKRKIKEDEKPVLTVILVCNRDGVSLSESEAPFLGSQGIREKRGANTKAIRKEIRTWTPTDDVVLISSWLNTSKDPIVGNEQRSTAFWKRIAGYYNASPKLDGCEKREAAHCKNRWHKINDIVCKFCGAYEAANREKTSGKNENDFLKLAHEIFFTNHNKKFTLEQLGKNCVMTRSGVSCLRLKMIPKIGSVRTANIQQALLFKKLLVPRVLRLQKPVVRRRWWRGRIWTRLRLCGASSSRILRSKKGC